MWPWDGSREVVGEEVVQRQQRTRKLLMLMMRRGVVDRWVSDEHWQRMAVLDTLMRLVSLEKYLTFFFFPSEERIRWYEW